MSNPEYTINAIKILLEKNHIRLDENGNQIPLGDPRYHRIIILFLTFILFYSCKALINSIFYDQWISGEVLDDKEKFACKNTSEYLNVKL